MLLLVEINAIYRKKSDKKNLIRLLTLKQQSGLYIANKNYNNLGDFFDNIFLENKS